MVFSHMVQAKVISDTLIGDTHTPMPDTHPPTHTNKPIPYRAWSTYKDKKKKAFVL